MPWLADVLARIANITGIWSCWTNSSLKMACRGATISTMWRSQPSPTAASKACEKLSPTRSIKLTECRHQAVTLRYSPYAHPSYLRASNTSPQLALLQYLTGSLSLSLFCERPCCVDRARSLPDEQCPTQILHRRAFPLWITQESVDHASCRV